MLTKLCVVVFLFGVWASIDSLLVLQNPEKARIRAAKHSMLAHRLLPDWALKIIGHTQS